MKTILRWFIVAVLVVQSMPLLHGQITSQATGSLKQPRYAHSAVALPNGKVLIVAGQGERAVIFYVLIAHELVIHPEFVSTAELFDPSNGSWSSAGSLTTNRFGHASVLLGSKVFVTGGESGYLRSISGVVLDSFLSAGPTSRVEVYDSDAATWATAGSMLQKRAHHTAVALQSGKILVAGGLGSFGVIGLSSGLTSAELYDPATGTWTGTGAMSRGRAGHVSLLLPDGKVLVFGGASSTPTDAGELYDPATGTWGEASTTPNVPNLFYHAATRLVDGRVYVLGQTISGTAGEAWIYDPKLGTWSSGGAPGTARKYPTVTLMPDSRVFIAGGDLSAPFNFPDADNQTSSAEVYNPATGQYQPFSGADRLRSARQQHTATLLPNGKLLLVGSTVHEVTDGNDKIRLAEKFGADTIYNPAGISSAINRQLAFASAELITFPPAPVTPVAVPLAAARTYHTTTALGNGDAVVAGGFDGANYLTSAAVFSQGAQTWQPTGSLNVPRSGHGAAGLFNGNVLVLGGLSTAGIIASAEVFAPVSDGWTSTAPMANARLFPTATTLFDGTVLVTGGSSVGFFGSMNSAELFNPAAGTWSTVGALGTARVNHTATLLFNGKVLVTGGYNSGSLSSAELYDPVSKTWSATGSMLLPRDSHTATLLADGTVLVAGGRSNFVAQATAEVFDPVTGTWSLAGGMAASRFAHTATFLLGDNRVLVVGGDNGAPSASTELYDPVARTWSASTPLGMARSLHTATLLGNGKVLLAFGSGAGTGGVVASSELYNPAKPPIPLTYTTGGEVALTTNDTFNATGHAVDLSLNFAPPPGTTLTVVRNTGTNFLRGALAGLVHGQRVVLFHGGSPYEFAANYYGGASGRDLVLEWVDTRLVAWGVNANGQLGDNTTTNRPAPVGVLKSIQFGSFALPTLLSGKTVIRLAAGGSHTLALCADGTVLAWGANGAGQLGNNANTDSTLPVAVVRSGVLTNKTVVTVGAGLSHSVALCSDGTVAAWGGNGSGQLGDGSFADSKVPVLINASGALAGKGVVAIAVGGSHTLALCSDGTLVAWGYNADGELGNNSFANSNLPVLVSRAGALNGKTVTAIAGGFVGSLALCSDGTLAAWGFGGGGQLGNGGFANSSVPVVVDRTGVLSGKTVTDITAGWYHNVVLCADGTLAAWGFNAEGQLGNGTTSSSAVPVLVDRSGTLSGKTVRGISAGLQHTVARCADNTLVAWGLNAAGQLGDGTLTNRLVPAPVSTALLKTNDVVLSLVSGGGAAHTIAAVSFVPTTRVAWISQNFTNAADQGNPAISGPLGNPTGDGVPNIVKYAFGLDPKTTNNQPLFQTSTSSPGGGGTNAPKYLSMSFSVPDPSPVGANFYLQQVPNATATNWLTLASKLSDGPWIAGNGGTVQLATPSGGKVAVTIFSDKPIGGTNIGGFMRLLLELPE